MMRTCLAMLACVVLAGGVVTAAPVRASTPVPAAAPSNLSGTVQDLRGKPLDGVMVRLSDEASGLADSTFTDAQGKFHLSTSLAGSLEIRFRLPYFQDETRKVSLEAGQALEQDASLKRMTGATDISESLPSAYHFGNIAFDKEKAGIFSRANLQRDCAGCHALGNSVTRAPRPLEAWVDVVKRMQGYLGNPDPKLIESRAALLAAGFRGQAPKVRPVFPVAADLGKAVIHEYRLENILFPHDADIGATDGLMYTVDRAGNRMVITDLAKGTSVYIDQPPSTRPAVSGGNAYSNRSTDPGPHSLVEGKTGLWYTTNSSSDEIGVFDPKTRTWKDSFVIPEPGRYPHTLRVAGDGIIWFTLAASSQVGRLDPVSGDIKLINLPRMKPLGGAGGTLPYGIDISPVDGRVWYARLWGDKIGAIDPTTLAVTEFDSPVQGPRRLRFDASGALWLTGYSEGMIARVDTGSMKSEVFAMPEFAKGYRPAPYALAIHPATQEVWINETSTDRVYRFLPKEKRFIVYPMPLRGTFTRDFAFTKSGWACTPNSPILNAALEGSETELICIDADGAGSRN